MQVKRVKIEKESVFDLLGFLFKGLKNEKGIPLENDATRDINSYFIQILNKQDKGFLRKTCKTLRKKCVIKLEKWGKNETTLCDYAAYHGFLFLLQWALKNGYHWNKWTCAYAARGGHLNVLQWAREQDPPYPWDELTCSEAAKGGHLNVLEWARKQDPPCPWDKWTCDEAAKHGHLNVLQWAREQVPPCPWNIQDCILDVLLRNLYE